MKAKKIMDLVDELVRISRDLGNIVKHGTFGKTEEKDKLNQKCAHIREELQAFADEHERLTENPR